MKVPEFLPIFIGDLECVAFFDYQPAEPEVNAGESVTLCAVEYNGHDITNWLTSEEVAEVEEGLLFDLHEYMADYHEGRGDYLRDLRMDA